TVGTDGTPRSAPGLTFDTGFEPDAMYALIAGGGNETTGLGAFFVDRVFLETGGDANSAGSGYLGDGTSLAVVPTHDGSLGTVGVGVTSGLLVQLDNTNIAGVPAACPNDDPSQIAFGGSEINAVYGFIEQTGNAPGPFGTGVNFLNLFVAGNLETADAGPDSNGGNKLNVFFDVNANEGQNRLGFNPTGAPAGDLSGISFGGLQNQEGVIFPNGFTADYWVAAKSQGQNLGVIFNINDVSPIYTEGSIDFPGNNSLFSFAAFDRIPMPAPVTFDGGPAFDEISEANGNLVNFAPRTVAKTENNNPDPESIIEGLTIISPPPPFTPLENRLDPIPGLIEYAIDNSNDGGITNTSGTGGETVTTGFEWRIDLAELGWDGTSPVRVFGYITGADFNFVSNQVIGGLPSAFDTINLSTASDAAGTVVNPADPDDQDTAGPLSADLDFSNTAIFPGVTDLVIPIGSTGTPCPPDQNEDNVLDIDDFSAFVQNFFAGDTLADVNDDGSLDIDDFSDFVAFFFNSGQFPGCPS
ncbi:MAG: EF-hand domain-containing protein, partial [Planctomycetota bacterium]